MRISVRGVASHGFFGGRRRGVLFFFSVFVLLLLPVFLPLSMPGLSPAGDGGEDFRVVSVGVFSGGGVSGGYVSGSVGAGETGWWSDWVRDRNRNHIDDLLENLDTEKVDPSRVIVDYSREPTAADIASLREMGLDVVYVARHINAVFVEGWSYDTLPQVVSLPGVVMVEADVINRVFLDVSARAIKARDSDLYSGVWTDFNLTGEGINIAVMDTGVDDTIHHAFTGKFVGGADYSRRLAFTNVNPNDDDGHGTLCAGIALGTGADIDSDGDGEYDYIGVAPGAGLVDVKVMDRLGTSTSTQIIAAMDWCIDHLDDYKIRVLSASFGSSTPSDGNDAESREVNALTEHGIVVVAAVGNDGTAGIPAPAAADMAIAVGAVDDRNTVPREDDIIASYSNYGPRTGGTNETNLTLADLKPEIVAPGSNITAPLFNTFSAYTTASGTSMAAPHISGTVALMLDASPFLSIEQIRDILKSTAEHRGTPSFPEIDPYYNVSYGWGEVDAYAAVKTAMETAPEPLNPVVHVISSTAAEISWSRYNGTGFGNYTLVVSEIPSWMADTVDQTADQTNSSSNSTFETSFRVVVRDRFNTSVMFDNLSAGKSYTVSLFVYGWGGENYTAGDVEFAMPDGGGSMSAIPPEAYIDVISPQVAIVGEYVFFSGHGEDVDGNITGYAWYSDIDGLLSTSKNFSTASLSPGNHTITFRVVDDTGLWSHNATSWVLVYTPVSDVPVLNISEPENMSVFVRGEIITFRGNASDADGLESITYAVDDGEWTLAHGLEIWWFRVETSSLEPGNHTVWIRAVDVEGNNRTVWVEIQMIPSPEEIAGGFLVLGGAFCGLLGLLFVVFIVAVAVLLSRKGRSPPPAPAYPHVYPGHGQHFPVGEQAYQSVDDQTNRRSEQSAPEDRYSYWHEQGGMGRGGGR